MRQFAVLRAEMRPYARSRHTECGAGVSGGGAGQVQGAMEQDFGASAGGGRLY